MNNQELELKIKEILATENFFDMIEEVMNFEKEYKMTGFYKRTKMPLIDVIKSSKAWYTLQLKDLGEVIQNMINGLSFENINDLIGKFGDVYSQENDEILSIINEFKDIVK